MRWFTELIADNMRHILQEQSVKETWEKTAWAKKIQAKKNRASTSDFDRFKIMIAKKQRSKIIADKLTELA